MPTLPPIHLQVEIINPDQTLFQGPALSLSSINHQGKFDILPAHTHFISLIKDHITLRLPNKSSQKFSFKQGVLRCVDNQIQVYLGI